MGAKEERRKMKTAVREKVYCWVRKLLSGLAKHQQYVKTVLHTYSEVLNLPHQDKSDNYKSAVIQSSYSRSQIRPEIISQLINYQKKKKNLNKDSFP